RRSVPHYLDDLPGCPGEQVLADEGIELAVEDRLGVTHLEAGTGILDELVRVEDIGTDGLAAEACVGRASTFLRQQGLSLLFRLLDEPRLQDAHRRLLVGRLDRKSTRLNSSHSQIS